MGHWHALVSLEKMSNAKLDLEAVWKEVKRWPVSVQAELCIKLANSIHAKSDKQKLSRSKARIPKQK
jgi:hypothetical protein